MNYYKIILILVIFFKTGNVFSDTNIFNVNNVEIEKKVTSSNEELAIKAQKALKNYLIKFYLRRIS